MFLLYYYQIMAIKRLVSLIIVYSILQVNAQWNTKDYMKREHSLIKPYQGASIAIPNWKFHGSTIVTSNYIRLTSDQQSKQGAVWNEVPCHVHNWELQAQFKVHGHGKELFGDGMAFWYTKDRMMPGPVFGNTDFFKGLAIIIDTYSNHNGDHNHQHPYISGMVNNGSLHYDHDRDGTHTQLAGCETKLRNVEHDTHIVVRYERDTLTVSTDFESKAAWKECFSVKGVKLPTGYFFGVSAATGDLSDNHDIISMRLFELDTPSDEKDGEDRTKIIPSASLFEPPREHIDDPKPTGMSGIKMFLLMLVAVIGVIVAIVIGIIYFQKHQENSRKRFY